MPIVLPFLRAGDAMKNEVRNEEPKTRSIILPQFLWDILDRDAKRCRRSATKQVEAILVRYYNVEANVDLDERSIAEATNLVSEHRKTA
jgi:hypothetical protein